MLLEPLRKLPEPIKKLIRPLGSRLVRKDVAELSYWKSKHRTEGGTFGNDHYQRLMLAMAEKPSDSFLKAKVVADFGCGPRGSLAWAGAASMRIGIDLLASRYVDAFPNDIRNHDMVYLTSTERMIPLPRSFVDIMFTINAMDHVKWFEVMCDEILRVLKPGGLFIGSFNLGERSTATEPQTLTEERIQTALLDRMQVISYQVSNQGPPGKAYQPFFDGDLRYDHSTPGILWIRAARN